MQFQAEIVARQEEGTLERILRVCRHRKFAILSLRAVVDPEKGVLRIHIEGESELPFVLLARQLEKLFEVVDVALSAPRRETLAKAQAQALETRPHLGQVRRTVYASTSHG